MGGVTSACKNNASMYRMQTEKLQFNEEQEKQSRSYGNEKVLQILQNPYYSQRNQIINFGKRM